MPYKFITNLRTKNKLEKNEDGKVFNYWRKVTDCDCTTTNEKVLYDSNDGCKDCSPGYVAKKSTNLSKFNEGKQIYNFSYNTYHKKFQKNCQNASCHTEKNGNPYFYQYGGVSSSSRIARLKHDAK